ncbi:MAG: hypothetical protein NT168_00620, partial [Planctomycetota bacterium]|nr:hypothetical protein [Planctomycetota bacterium]
AVRTAIEYEYRFTEYRFAEYEYDEIRCEARSAPSSHRNQQEQQPSPLKTPPLARRAELLGTIALHCKTPPLARRQGAIGAIALL